MSARTPALPDKPRTWIAYQVRGAKAVMLGHVDASDWEGAIAAAAAEFGMPASRIIVRAVSRH